MDDSRHAAYLNDHQCEKEPSSSPPALVPMTDPREPLPSTDPLLQDSFDSLTHEAPPEYMHHTAIPDSTDEDLFPIHNTRVTCCHCDNTQNLLEEWNPHTGEHRAVCNVCTWAFCLRCHIEPAMNVTIFRGAKAVLPKLPSRNSRYMFLWLCSTCETDEAIEERSVRQRSTFATVDLKKFLCSHCTQNATRGCIFLAMSVYWESPNRSTHSLSTLEVNVSKRAATASPKVRSGGWSKLFKKMRKV